MHTENWDKRLIQIRNSCTHDSHVESVSSSTRKKTTEDTAPDYNQDQNRETPAERVREEVTLPKAT